MPHAAPDAPHIPVLLGSILKAVAPITGVWLDGTMGAGGYTRAFLDAGARVIGVDRDPLALSMAAQWGAAYGDRLQVVHGTFSQLDTYSEDLLDGVVLDLGVSSMQLDQAERGFSFAKDGPLDMRMSQDGVSAADLVNTASEGELADILFHYGEERASRRIARAIVRARDTAPITRTLELSGIVSACLPRPKPGQSHPATRSFQALRIAVNTEFHELIDALEAAERALKPGGLLVVVSFHSLEDRIVKRFMQLRAGRAGQGSRHAPQIAPEPERFDLITRRAIAADDAECAANPRARSALLRIARRTGAAAGPVDRSSVGLPRLAQKGDH